MAIKAGVQAHSAISRQASGYADTKYIYQMKEKQLLAGRQASKRHLKVELGDARTSYMSNVKTSGHLRHQSVCRHVVGRFPHR